MFLIKLKQGKLKFDILRKNFSIVLFFLLIVSLILFLNKGALSQSLFDNFFSSNKGKIKIVIDPGHGGLDKGLMFPSESYESNIVLSLAKMISNKLDKQFDVFLTRNDDYASDIIERSGFSNNINPELFISIHVEKNKIKSCNMSILYFNGDSTNNNSCSQQDNKKIAEAFKVSIAEHLNMKVSIKEAPVLILKTVCAPSILIEISYSNNPSDKYLMDVSNGICKGIFSIF
ncbi:MAG: N-acetylmuramoyl-L-alanine amidase [Desulfobacterales bacterium]|nr:N-acetylmuramoyl-L-alanine amidase [Desulfobacterales bacterium]